MKRLKTPSGRAAATYALLLALAMGLSACGVVGGKKKVATPTVGDRIPILSRIESGAKVDAGIDALSVILPPMAANPDWPQAGGTANKSYGHLGLGGSPSRIWSASVAGSGKKQRLAAAPVIGDGKLFVMDTEGLVTAFNADSGSRLWTSSFKVSGDGASSVFGGGVSYDNGRAYVTTGVGEVAAVDATNGSVLWKVKPAGPLRGSPTIAFNAIFVMTQNNEIHALNPSDGSSLWAKSGSVQQSGVFGVAAPAAGRGTVIAGYSSGELVAYRYENGRELWSDALSRTSISTEVGSLTDVDADPIIDRDQVFALGQGGRMAAYELVTGQRLWELNLAGISTPAVAGDWVFTLTDDAQLLAIQRGTGKVRWKTQLRQYRKVSKKKKKGAIYWVGPVLAGNRLWLGNSLGELSYVNPVDGSLGAFTKLGDSVSLAPVVANQTLYVLDDSGKITAFR